MATQVVINVNHIVDHSLGSLQTSSRDNLQYNSHLNNQPAPDALLFILPLLIVLSTFLFILLIFLVCVIFVRRRRGIVLRDSDGPTDMSREEVINGEGGLEGVESRWLESVSENTRRSYLRAKGHFHFSNFLIPFSSTLAQITNCNMPQTRSLQISRYLNSFLSRRKAFQHGLLSPTTKLLIHFWFMLAPKSPSFLILHLPRVCSQIYPSPN
jgi:hypothetical protein